MIKAIGAAHAVIRAKKRRDEPANVTVEVKRRRHMQQDGREARPDDKPDARGSRP